MRRTATKATATPTRVSGNERAEPGLPVWLMAVLLLLVTVALYWPATRCDFVSYDDQEFLTENPHVQGGVRWEAVQWAFCNTEQPAYWAPLMWLSHMLAWQCFGLNAWGHHLINVLLHATNTALVFLLFRRLTRATWRSLMAAALFGLHPLRVESVAWVTERKDVLSGLFGLLALLAYAHWAQAQSLKSKVQSLESAGGTEDADSGIQKPPSPNTQHVARNTQHAPRFTFHVSRVTAYPGTFYLLSLFCFALGLMSKPTLMVTLPCVMLLLDYWPLRRHAEYGRRNAEPGAGGTVQGRTLPRMKLVWEKAPFFVLAAVASVMTFIAQKQGGNLASNAGLPLGARLGNALISYCRYLGKLFWPTDLAVFYPQPRHWPLGQMLLAGGLLLGLSVLFFMQRRRYPYLLMGWLWFSGALVPVIGLVQAGAQAMADRFTYVPSLGVLILAVWGASELTRTWHDSVKAFSVAGGAAIVLCLALTRQQLGYWQDSEALFRHALEVTENNWVAHNNLGIVLDDKGQSDEATRHYEAALRANPEYADAHNNLGAALDQKGQIDEAIRHYQAALRLKPDHAGAHKNLGLALGKKGQVDEAIRQYLEAIRLKPEEADIHSNLGVAFAMKGQLDEAILQFQEALRLKPDHAEAHYNLGRALDLKGKTDEAIRQYQEAVRLKPDHADAHNNLGLALGRKGRTDEAIRQYQEAIRLKPDHAEAHNNLGIAFYQQRRTSEAIRQFQDALRLNPDFVSARKNLDVVLAAGARSSPPPGGATNP
jgi:protein O-mannosyl-transferase